ncbi:MAG: helix-turn-helix domain-containing protein [Clostridiales bacterium]|nr:helix-turn-helix domain-containing protein [Clostridiales bacterium]
MNIFKKEHFLINGEKLRPMKQNSKYSKPHKHEFIEFTYFFSGAGVNIIDGVEYEIRDGSLFFVELEQVHSIITANDKSDYVDLLISPDYFSTQSFSSFLTEELGLNTSNSRLDQAINFSGSNRIVINEIVRNMLNEYEKRQCDYEQISRHYFDILVSYIKRTITTPKEKSRYRDIDTVMPEVLDYINSNYTKGIMLSDIAQKYHYNADYFSRAFKNYFNINFVDYLNERKIENAIDMLRYEVYNIDMIAQLSGFTNKTQFYKLFRDKTGKTPNEYRQELIGNSKLR